MGAPGTESDDAACGCSPQRNFAVGNLATVFLYAAVSLGTLVVALFLQEGVGMSASMAGLATLPMPVLSFFLAPRFGTLAGRHGPRRTWRSARSWRPPVSCC